MPVGLDKFASPGAFRLILALSVFVHHTTNFNIGMSAVLIFFILSGYWVSTMWTGIYAETRLSYFTYLVSRAWRVIPAFALCSVVSWGLLYATGRAPAEFGSAARQIFSNLLILGYNSLPYQANIPAWSLDVELQFYIIAPLVIVLIASNIWALGACVVVSFAAGWYGGAATVAPFLYFFAIGATAASHDIKPSEKMAYTSLYLTLAVMFVCGLLLIKNLALGEFVSTPPHAFNNVTSIVIALIMAPWAIYTTRQPSPAQDRMFGDLSYIFYLLHWSVLGAFGTGDGSDAAWLVHSAGALIVTLAASYLIWRAFDQPINKLRAEWVASRKAAPAPVPPQGANVVGIAHGGRPLS